MTRAVVVDTDGLNPYGVCVARAVSAAGVRVAFYRRRAPVRWTDGIAFGPLRGAAGLRFMRAGSLLASAVRLATRVGRGDALHLMWESPLDAALATLAKGVFRRRVIATIHDPRREGTIAAFAVAVLARTADVVVVHSVAMATELGERTGRREDVVVARLPAFDSVVDHVDPVDARRDLGVDAETLSCLFFGRIRAYKGMATLMASFDEVITRVPNVQLFIVGSCPDPALVFELEAWARQKNGQVRLDVRREPVPESLLEAHLAAADLIVLPFDIASQSSSVSHAMTVGKPVLTTRTGELVDWERRRVVAAVEPGDAAAFAAAAVELLNDAGSRTALAARGSAFATSELDPGALGRRLAALYDGASV